MWDFGFCSIYFHIGLLTQHWTLLWQLTLKVDFYMWGKRGKCKIMSVIQGDPFQSVKFCDDVAHKRVKTTL